MMCETCPHDGYCIPDDCAWLTKKSRSLLQQEPTKKNMVNNKIHAKYSMG